MTDLKPEATRPADPPVRSADNQAVDAWESAYLRFETPEREIAKFQRRLRNLGIDRTNRDARVVELFCGRGNGLHALSRLGFTHLEGVDLSPRLIGCYRGSAECLVADCRQLPFPDHSRDILIVQGGLHHLPTLPESLDCTLQEIRRVLRKDGKFVAVEPWLTPFLRVVHAFSEIPVVRRMSNKIDALATMIEHERQTYEQWLTQPALVVQLAHSNFSPVHEEFSWGKWQFVGKPR
jgi:SAM-dependent methyltransferase